MNIFVKNVNKIMFKYLFQCLLFCPYFSVKINIQSIIINKLGQSDAAARNVIDFMMRC